MQLQEKLDAVRHIQNALWGMYKEFLSDHDVRAYTGKAAALMREYGGREEMLHFAQNLAISWAPVISGLAGDFREGRAG